MPLVDVHCHINHELFKEILDAVIKRAQKAGVHAIILSGVNPENNKEVLRLSQKYPIIKASLGIYPIDALGLGPDEGGLPLHKGPINIDEEFAFFEKNIERIISIGEIGMDFYAANKEETFAKQEENFRKIINFAKKVKKPIVIHSRKAEKECIDVLEDEIKHKEIDVVQHCFSGKKSQMTRAIELGHYFSIPPNIIIASNFQTLVKKCPLSQLLTETDSPWLSPYKDRPNEPAFVAKTIEKIAEVKGMNVKEVEEQIWQNYLKVFKDKI
jgi:TatD DNase family protein